MCGHCRCEESGLKHSNSCKGFCCLHEGNCCNYNFYVVMFQIYKGQDPLLKPPRAKAPIVDMSLPILTQNTQPIHQTKLSYQLVHRNPKILIRPLFKVPTNSMYLKRTGVNHNSYLRGTKAPIIMQCKQAQSCPCVDILNCFAKLQLSIKCNYFSLNPLCIQQKQVLKKFQPIQMTQQDALQFEFVYYCYHKKVVKCNQIEPLALL